MTLFVAGFLNMEEKELWDIHDGGKIGKSSIRDLTWFNNKAVVNKFEAGVEVSLKF